MQTKSGSTSVDFVMSAAPPDQRAADRLAAHLTAASPDVSIYVVSAPLVAQWDNASYPADARLRDDLRQAIADSGIELEVLALGKSFAYNDKLSKGEPIRVTLQRFLREATVVWVLCTPVLCKSKQARDLVDAALNEQIDRPALRVASIDGIRSEWRRTFPDLARLVSSPRDRRPIERGSGRDAALVRVAQNIKEVVLGSLLR